MQGTSTLPPVIILLQTRVPALTAWNFEILRLILEFPSIGLLIVIEIDNKKLLSKFASDFVKVLTTKFPAFAVKVLKVVDLHITKLFVSNVVKTKLPVVFVFEGFFTP